MKKSTLIIAAHPVTKVMLTPSKKEGWSTMRVDQKTYSLEGPGGIKPRSAFITKKNEDWAILTKVMNLQAGLPISGQIVREEKRTPFYEGQNPKKNPTTNEIVLVDGQAVFFQDTYTEDLTAKDELILSSAKSNVQVSVELAA